MQLALLRLLLAQQGGWRAAWDSCGMLPGARLQAAARVLLMRRWERRARVQAATRVLVMHRWGRRAGPCASSAGCSATKTDQPCIALRCIGPCLALRWCSAGEEGGQGQVQAGRGGGQAGQRYPGGQGPCCAAPASPCCAVPAGTPPRTLVSRTWRLVRPCRGRRPQQLGIAGQYLSLKAVCPAFHHMRRRRRACLASATSKWARCCAACASTLPRERAAAMGSGW